MFLGERWDNVFELLRRSATLIVDIPLLSLPQILLLIAHAIFLIGTVICATAPSMVVLIVGRAIAGIGGAGLFSMVSLRL